MHALRERERERERDGRPIGFEPKRSLPRLMELECAVCQGERAARCRVVHELPDPRFDEPAVVQSQQLRTSVLTRRRSM